MRFLPQPATMNLSMKRHLLSPALALLGAAFGNACVDWGDPDAAPATSASTNDRDDCRERCDAKAKGCGATDDFAEMHCSTFCGGATPMEVDCLEAATCGEIGVAFQTGTDICEDEEENTCVAVGSAGCDPFAGITCCDLATCEASTGRCCLPANQPHLACTSNGQCCGSATCQVDPNDGSTRYCR
jgi:hypothetical protein